MSDSGWDILPVIGPMIGAGVNYFGQQSANESNAWIAQNNNIFNASQAAWAQAKQEEMRATAYQTTVKDMKLAGLNPMLAAMKNGATGSPSAPQASSSGNPTMQNTMGGIGNAISNALDGMRVNNELKNSESTRALQAASAAKEGAAAIAATSTARLNDKQSRLLDINKDAAKAEADERRSGAAINQSYQKIQKIMDLVGQGVQTGATALNPIRGIMDAITNRKNFKLNEGVQLNKAGRKGLPLP